MILTAFQGWSGPKQLNGEYIEGSFNSHQVPLPKAKSNKQQLGLLQEWLSGYKPGELFTANGDVIDEIKSVIPTDNAKKLGQRIESYNSYVAPKLPDWKNFCAKKGSDESAMKAIGKLINAVFVENPHNVRLFSPDELESNKLDPVLGNTDRNFQWDEFSNARGGRVIEVLSEHMCQGFMQGYTLTGRTGIFPSYESFLGIIHTMMVQYAKFIKMVRLPLVSVTFSCSDFFSRPEKPHGMAPLAVSTISKPAPGPARSTMGSPTRTHPSSAPCSSSSPPPLASTYHRMQTHS